MRVRYCLLFATFLFLLCNLSAQSAQIKKLEIKLSQANSAEEPAIRLQLASLYKTSDVSKALEHAKQCITGAKKTRNNELLADAYHIIGDIFHEQNDPKNALKHYESELEMRKNDPDSEHLAQLYFNLGSICNNQNKSRKSIGYFEKSLSTAKKLNIKPLILKNYEALFSTSYSQGDYKEAMTYFKGYIHIEDSSFQVKKSKEISKIVSNYETEKQQKDLQIGELSENISEMVSHSEVQNTQIGELNKLAGQQQLEIRNKELMISRKNMVRNFLIVLLVFISMVIFLLFNLYSSKKKANIRLAGQNAEIQEQKEEIKSQRDAIASQLYQLELLNKELGQQKEEITAQRDEIEEKSAIIEQTNTDITKSIEYALRIQQAILPTSSEITAVFPDSFVLYKPKDIVSGDFYWISTIPGNRAFVAAVDCTGHGVPGGFMSMIGIEKLNDIVSQAADFAELHPAQILKLLDQEIRRTLRQTEGAATPSDGMDIALCEFNFENGEVWFAGANRPLWLIKNNSGELIEYAAVKKGIGGSYEEDLEYRNQILEIDPGDMIYIFTDGYPDQFGGENKRKLMKKNLKMLLSSVHQLPADKQCQFLDNYFISWKKEEIQVDDMLVTGIRYNFNNHGFS